MADAPSMSRPAWQTDELEDEWIEELADDQQDHDQDLSFDVRSISLTAPLPTEIRTSVIERDPATTAASPADLIPSPPPAGTFLVREDVPAVPMFPKTPGRNKKGRIKDFFSPLPLERMFEPPSPPLPQDHISSKQTERRASRQMDTHDRRTSSQQSGNKRVQTTKYSSDTPPSDLRKANLECQFTFSVPRSRALEAFPQAHSTPGPPSAMSNGIQAPLTDPRLRLFQFQYDTFTREHLSAMVDSIAINTTSADSGTGNQSPEKGNQGLSPVSELTDLSASDLRSAKRVKLSPGSDFYGEGDGAGAVISRPKNQRKDYVGESRSLMQQIRQARDFSTISTATSVHAGAVDQSKVEPKKDSEAPRTSFLGVPDKSRLPTDTSGGTPSPQYSSSTYRQQAANLMAQIRNDMKGSKRLFSCESDASQLTHVSEKTKASLHTHYSFRGSKRSEDKENILEDHPRHATRRPAKPNALSFLAKTKSPKNTAQQLTVPEEVHHRLVDGVSRLSIKGPADRCPSIVVSYATFTQPDAQPEPPRRLERLYPSSAVRPSAANEDLNRFVSSSTASGTTLTAGSTGSLVKHPGPAQIRRIAPEDVPALPERVGKMIFDKVMMRWVKATAVAVMGATREDQRDLGDGTEGESDDPFRDIESLREDDSVQGGEAPEPTAEGVMSRIEEVEEMHDEEERDLNSFSFDDASAAVVDVMTGVETDDGDQTTDSEDLVVLETDLEPSPGDEFDSEDESQIDHYVPAHDAAVQTPEQEEEVPAVHVPQVAVVFGTPLQAPRGPTLNSTPVLRSVLKSGASTPMSAMKNPNRQRTPTSKSGHRRRRSVSFSDGKREGPIRGLTRSADAEAVGQYLDGPDFVPSARSKRIAALVDDLEESEFDENESPSKVSGSVNGDLQSLMTQNLSVSANATAGSSSNGGGGGSSSSESPRRGTSSVYAAWKRNGGSGGGGKDGRRSANATFLTDCSFGLAHDKLVQVITDVVPFEPHWEGLSCIDLSNHKIESVARLKEFLPQLDTLQLNSNQLSWLSGVPESVRTLSVACNSLSSMTSYSHLRNLECLDISRNDIDSLRQLECLRHLRELRADGNKIGSFDGLQRLERLEKLSMRGNCVRSVDVKRYRWSRLEMLNMCENGLEDACGLASLGSLMSLNLDHNSLREIDTGGVMVKLRILRASNNRLQGLNAEDFPNLRTLYLDNNALRDVENLERLPKLENVSLRNQSGRELNFLTRDAREVKRLYLSGNPLTRRFLDEPCYQLVYLELAACRLRRLPDGLAQLLPNVRVLNLNYNFLEDARGLAGLVRLRKLTIIGSRLKETKGLIRLLQGLPELEMLDCRMNPCTLGWYLPLLVKDVAGALQPCGGQEGRGGGGGRWSELDRQFRRDLPDDVYVGRLAYRGLVMRACAKMRTLDGVGVTEKERSKAEQVIQGLLHNNNTRNK